MNPSVLWAFRWHVLLAQILFGYTPRFISGFRTREEQTALFRGEIATPNPVAFPGSSQHEFGFAYDLAPDVFPGSADYNKKLDELRWLGLALGMSWGGAQDPQHWQAFSRNVWNSIVAASPLSRGLV